MAMEAFDLAERFQTLVFVMSDLDLGMNTWMSQTFTYPDQPLDRGKVLDAATLARIGRVGPLPGRRRRRHSVSHDPGRRHAGVLHARLRAQRKGAVQRAAGRLRQEHGPAGAQVRDGAPARAEAGGRRRRRARTIGIIGFGTQPLGDRREPRSARARGRPQDGYLRLRAYPFTDELDAFIDRYERIYVVEQNRDAQMLSLMRLELARRADREAAQACSTTTACRSTRARSPTRS